MHIILARHGNTFDPGDEPVWVGARTDLPLVSKGRDQAAKIGEALLGAGMVPKRTLAGPLKRTQETASLALAAAGASAGDIEVDGRLCEIDYGIWEGRSSDELCRMGWGDAVKAWDADDDWPSSAGWPFSRDDYLRHILDVLGSVSLSGDDPTLIVSSNGLFKILARSIADGPMAGKMATGNMALLRSDGGRCHIVLWNVTPSMFAERAAC